MLRHLNTKPNRNLHAMLTWRSMPVCYTKLLRKRPIVHRIRIIKRDGLQALLLLRDSARVMSKSVCAPPTEVSASRSDQEDDDDRFRFLLTTLSFLCFSTRLSLSLDLALSVLFFSFSTFPVSVLCCVPAAAPAIFFEDLFFSFFFCFFAGGQLLLLDLRQLLLFLRAGRVSLLRLRLPSGADVFPRLVQLRCCFVFPVLLEVDRLLPRRLRLRR
mmetsp:Transcript_158231/g.507539  ORF Transcript_158231/g.507539 Transcript_158231/m.507539 type:complete len:215 (+) Transcript_158231:125-769(+)